MGLNELFESRGWKLFMAKLYGIGASVVIVGALFKIMHWPFAGLMLIIGLGTEAIIFFFSAFEPLHEEDDWSLVFPQLAGLDPEDEFASVSGGSGVDTKAIAESNEKLVAAIENMSPKSPGSTLAKFDKMIEDAKIGPELFQNLGNGLNHLSDSTNKLSDLTDATVATNEYVKSTKTASESLNTLSNTNNKVADELQNSVGNLTKAYSDNANVIAKNGDDLSSSYQSLIDSMTIDFSSVTQSNKNYSSELENINKNLSALNAVYELQLQSANESLQKSQEFYGALDKMMGDVKDSSQSSEQYRNEVSKLSKKLVALNTIYGNMLSAMNVNSDKL